MTRTLTLFFFGLACVLGSVLAYRNLVSPLGGTALDLRPAAPNVELLNDHQQKYSLAEESDKTRLVFFGFTRCPDVCPAALGALNKAYSSLTAAQQKKIQIIFVTVDPEFDTPKRLRTHLSTFNSNFLGLTGTPEALEKVRKGFYVYADQTSPGAFAHGDSVTVVDQKGHLRRVYNQGTLADGTLTRDLPKLAAGKY